MANHNSTVRNLLKRGLSVVTSVLTGLYAVFALLVGPGVVLASDAIPVIDGSSFSVTGGTTVSGTTYTNNRRPTIAINYSDDVGINAGTAVIRLNGVPNPAVTTADTSHISYAPSSNLAAATYNITFDVKDTADQSAVRVSKVVAIDITAPVAPVITTASGTTSSNQHLTVAGTAEANSLVTIFDGSTPVGTGTATGGFYNISTSALAAGDHTITATATDYAANQSGVSNAITYAVDLTAPSVPTLTPQGNTNNPRPTLSWSDADVTVDHYHLQIASNPGFAPTVADLTQGAASYTSGSDLPTGDIYWRVSAVDAYGNESAYASSEHFVLDNVQPSVTGVVISDPSPTKAGAVTLTVSFSKTMDTAVLPVVTFGTSDPAAHATSVAWSGNDAVASVTIPADGSFDGTNAIAVTGAKDTLGNAMNADATHSFVIDTVNPNVTVTAPTAGFVVASATTDVTWSATDTSGSGLAASPISLSYSTDGSTYTPIATGLANSGSYTWTVPIIDQANVTVKVQASDEAGNTGDGVSSVFAIDRVGPTAPSGTVTPAGTALSGGRVGTASRDITVSGTTDAQAASVTVSLGTISQTAPVAANAYAATFTGVADGTYAIIAQAADAHGNLSAQTTIQDNNYVVDATGPALGVFAPLDGSTTSNDLVQVSGAFTDSLAGVNTASLQLTIDGVPDESSAVWTLSAFAVTPLFSWGDGTHDVQVTVADNLGNISSLYSWSFTVASAPTLTSADATGGRVVSGYLNSTNTGVTVNGTVPADTSGDQTVSLYLDGSPFSTPLTVTVAHNATDFSFAVTGAQFAQLAGSQGDHSLSAMRKSFDGNESALGNALGITVDTVAPAVPVNLVLSQNGSPVHDTVSGTAGALDSGTTAVYAYDGTEIDHASRLADGSFAAIDLGDNAHASVDLRARDAAGNESAAATLSNDIVAPATPVIALPATDTESSFATPTVTGSAESGTTVTIYKNGSLVGTGTASTGSFSVTTDPLGADGSYALTVVSTDAAGNVSSLSAGVTYVLDTTAPVVSSVTLTDSTIASTSFAKNGDTLVLTAHVADANLAGMSASDITADFTSVGGGAAVNPASLVAGLATWTGLTVSASDGSQDVTVAATDKAGNSGHASHTIVVDNTAPTSWVVADDGLYALSLSKLHATWSATDSESGITGYSYAIGTTAGATDIKGKTSVGSDTQVTATGLTLAEAGTYYFTVYATNGAGTESNASSDGITVDTINPSAPVVTDDGDYTTNLSQLHATWTAATDAGSGISHYALGIGTTSGGTEIMPFTDVSNVTEYTATGLTLSNGATYYVSVKAVDNAGHESAVATSDGIMADNQAPTSAVQTPAADTAIASGNITVTWTEADSGFAGDPVRDMLVNGVSKATNWDGPSKTATFVNPGTFPDGTYHVVATVADQAGNVGTADFSFKVDTHAPTGDFDINNGDLSTNQQTVTLHIAATDPVGADATAGTGVAQTMVSENSGFAGATWQSYAPTYVYTFIGGDGSKTIYARFRDGVGNVSDTASQGIYLDTTGPAVTLNPVTTPSTNASPTITGNALDAGSMIGTVEYQLDGGAWNAASPADGSFDSNDENFTFSPSGLSDGSHTVNVRSTDSLGNTTAIVASATFVVDTTAPVVTLAPVSGNLTNDNTPTLAGTAVDALSNVTLVEYSVDGGAWTTADGTFGSLSVTYSLTATTLGDGSHTVRVRAKDALNNQSLDEGTSTTFTVDTQAPTVTVNVLATKNTSPALDGTVDDGTAAIVVTVNGSDYAATNNGATWSLAAGTITPALGNGTYEVAVKATDPANNIGHDATSDELVIDTVAPVLAEVTPVTTPTGDNTPSYAFSTTKAGAISYGGPCSSGTTAALSGTNTVDFNAVLDGTYSTCTVTVTDALGNVSDPLAVTAFTVDTTAPVVTVTSLKTNGTTPTVTGTVDGPTTSLTARVDGVDYAATNNGDHTWTAAVTGALAEGTYDVAVTATDAVGNIGHDATSNELIVDLTNPVATAAVAPVSPDGSNGWYVSAPSVSLDATDNLAGVASVQYSLDSGSSATYSTPVVMPEGTHTLHYHAIDNAGNPQDDQTLTVKVDTTAPSSVTATTAGGTTSDKHVNVSWTAATETGSGVDHYLLEAKLGDVVKFTGINVGNVTAYTLNDSQASLLTGDGSYTFGVKAVDVAGNSASDYSYSNAITVDTAAPTAIGISIDAGSTYANSPSVTLDLSASDPFMPVMMKIGNLADLSDGTWETYSASKAWTLAAGADGTRTVYAQFRDAGENTGDIVSDSIILDTTKPDVAVNAVVGTQTNHVNVSGTAEANAIVDATFSDGVHASILLETTATGGAWSFTGVNLSTLNDGTVGLSVTATDAAGNVSIPATTSFSKDGTNPSFSSIVASPANAKLGTAVAITFTASEALQADPTVTVGGRPATYSSNTGLNYAYSFVVGSGDAEGTQTIAVNGTDLVGNVGSTSGSMVIDKTAPVGSNGQALSDLPYTTKRPHIQVHLGDTGGSGVNVSSIVMRINGVVVTAGWDAETGTASYDPTRDLASRSYSIAIDAHDNAGNQAVRYSFTVIIP